METHSDEVGYKRKEFCPLGEKETKLKIEDLLSLNPLPPRKAKIVYNFSLSECNRVKYCHVHSPGEVTIYLYFLLSHPLYRQVQCSCLVIVSIWTRRSKTYVMLSSVIGVA